jgi:hypothetical protein
VTIIDNAHDSGDERTATRPNRFETPRRRRCAFRRSWLGPPRMWRVGGGDIDIEPGVSCCRDDELVGVISRGKDGNDQHSLRFAEAFGREEARLNDAV